MKYYDKSLYQAEQRGKVILTILITFIIGFFIGYWCKDLEVNKIENTNATKNITQESQEK